MSFETCYKMSSSVFIASSCLAVAVAGAIPPALLGLSGAALCLSWSIDTGRLHLALPRWVPRIAFLMALPASYLDFRFFSNSVIISSLRLVLFLSGLKLLTRRDDRDIGQLYILSFGCLLGAAALTQDSLYFVCLGLFLMSGVASLILFEMKRSSSSAMKDGMIKPIVVPRNLRGSGLELFSAFPWSTLSVASLVLAVVIAAGTIPLFLILPRTSLGAYPRLPGRPQLISGFSETVRLGAIGTIKTSNDLVMKVQVDAPKAQLPPDLKWRGIALDHFDGKSWSHPLSDRSPIPTQGGYFKLQAFTGGTDVLVQTFFLEPGKADVVFGSARVLAVSNDLGALERDAGDNIYTAVLRKSVTRYTVISDITRHASEMTLADTPVPHEIQSCCLQIPPEDSRISELAHRVTALAGTAFEKAKALETYLRSSYAYSLDLKGTPGHHDPLASFLFKQRRGHCEYFATAMAVMLRQLGIPSRLVNGFRTGEYNPVSDHWTVRQSDAHSWVEAFFPSDGWVEFDPTPADPVSPTPVWAKGVMTLVNALDFWWSDYVANYDLRKQSNLLRAGWASIQGFRQSAADFAQEAARNAAVMAGYLHPREGSLQSLGLIALLTVILLSMAALQLRSRHNFIRRFMRSIDPRRGRRDQTEAVIDFYLEALDILQQRGAGKNLSQTPLEFARNFESQPFGAALASLTSIYNRVRYGRVAQATDGAQALGHLRTIRKQVSGLPDPILDSKAASSRASTR